MTAIELPARAAERFDVERIRADFPILELEGERQAAGLSRQRRFEPDAAAGDRPPGALPDDASTRTSTAAVHYLSETATAEYEAARAQGAALHQRARRARSDLHQRHHRRHQSRGARLRPQVHRRGRRNHPDDARAPLEHRAVADAGGREGREDPRRADQRRAASCSIDEYEKLFNERTKLVGVTHVSNALGTINPVKEMIAFAHAHGVPVLVDGAQAAPHLTVDVQDLDCDFYAFSGHKMCGPTGIGILYGKAALLEKMQPFKGGGDMILSVTFEKTTYNAIPHKFEAGTPPIAAAIGLGAAVDYLSAIGIDAIAAHETDLLDYATEQVNRLPRRAHHRHGRDARPRCCRSRSRACIRTTSARC